MVGITLSSALRRKPANGGIQTVKPTVIAAAIFISLIDLVSAASLDTARIDQPRIMFFHYLGRGTAKDLAQAVKGGFLVGGLLGVNSPLQN